MEVAGPRTEVIIANPAGIQVDGGGFINVNRATLTTGTPQYGASGSLDSYVGSLHAGTIGITTTGDLNNQGGTLAGDSSVDLSVGGAVNNSNGTVSAVGALNANVAGALNNISGKLLGNGAVTVAAGSLNNTLGSVQSASGATQLTTPPPWEPTKASKART